MYNYVCYYEILKKEKERNIGIIKVKFKCYCLSLYIIYEIHKLMCHWQRPLKENHKTAGRRYIINDERKASWVL